MARYYDISVGNGAYHWTSHPGGIFGDRDPGALNVELDLSVAPGDVPAGTCFCRVWGIGRDVISQAQDLAFQPITILGGMGGGLPLANSSQSGLLVGGNIFQLFANWEGVNQSIDFLISTGGLGQITTPTPGPNPKTPPLNLVLNWLKGTPLSVALQQTLQQGMPDFTVNMNISSSIVAPQDQVGYYSTLSDLAIYVRKMSQTILGDYTLPGVSIIANANTLTVDDGSSPSSGGTIQFQDLVGQPTWIEFKRISIKCVMRADIKAGDTITMPANTLALGQLTYGLDANYAAFQGTFNVASVRHIGNFRQPDGTAWVTVIEATSNS